MTIKLCSTYKSGSIILSFDYGMFSDPLKSYSKKVNYQENKITIDGRDAIKIIYEDRSVKGFAYAIGLHVPLVSKDASNKTRLTMMAYCKDKKEIKLIEKIFGTIKFVKRPDESVLKLFGGQENFKIVQDYEKVTAYRIKPPLKSGETEIILSSVMLSVAQGDTLVQLFSDEKNICDTKKKCEPDSDILFTFEKGDQKMNLRIWFKCDMIIFGDTLQSLGDFDPIRPQLVSLVKEIFPQDEVMQNLK